MVETKDAKDSINVFLYDASNKTKLIAWTNPVNDYKTMSINLMPNIKSYQLKVVLDTNDEEINDDIYSLRLEIEPIA